MSTIFNTNTETVFAAYTREGYVFKQVAELLNNNIKTAYFTIDADTIKLRMMDSHANVLIDLCMFSENFLVYKFDGKKPLNVGLNLSHFYKMLRNTKKKDSIILFIEKDQEDNLGIQIIPKENNRISTSYIKIQNTQNLNIDLPSGYGRPVNVSAADYQKTCKDMGNISNTIKIISKGFKITLSGDAGAVYSREVVFGTEIVNTKEYKNKEYEGTFDTEKLIKITKLSGLTSNIKIYGTTSLPLLFKGAIGSLGDLSIYIKSREDLEKEKENYDSDDE
jgi:proliferating cell nuclear antigen PCNA